MANRRSTGSDAEDFSAAGAGAGPSPAAGTGANRGPPLASPPVPEHARLGRLITHLHREFDAILIAREYLRRRVFDAALVIGKESQRLDLRQRGTPLLAERDHQLTAPDTGGRRRPLRAGQIAPRRREERRVRRIDGAGRCAHRKLQLQIGILGNAHIGTDQPARLGRQRDRCACLQVVGRGDVDQMHGVPGIAVIHQGWNLETMRRGPGDVPRRESRRKLPLESRGLTGVAGIAPVGMPAVANGEFQGNPERLPRSDRAHLTHQMCLHIVGGNHVPRQREGGRRGQQQAQQPKFHGAHGSMLLNKARQNASRLRGLWSVSQYESTIPLGGRLS